MHQAAVRCGVAAPAKLQFWLRTTARVLAWSVALQLSAACGRLGFGLRAVDAGEPQTASADAAADPLAAFDAGTPDVMALPDAGMQEMAVADAGMQGTAAADAGAGPVLIADGPSVGPASAKLGRGFQQTCAITDGRLLCWGRNQAAQLGLGDTTDRNAPVQVGNAQWADACGGEFHSCGVQASGQLYCWGANTKGQLGTGDVLQRTSPVPVDGIDDAIAVTCEGEFTCALRQGGVLSCWGDNLEGALGQNDLMGAPDRSAPSLVAAGTAFRAVSAGQGHVCAVRMDGALLCWGRNSDAQAGIGTIVPDQLRAPMQVGTASDWIAVAAGQNQTCGIRAGGSLWCWGTDMAGLLGMNLANGGVVLTPTRVGSMSGWQQISAARLHTCGVTTAGALYCWGRGVEGQLGIGSTSAVLVPTRVGTASDWQEIAAGSFHSCGRRADGVWCWGENAVGQLGLGDTTRRSAPTRVNLP